MICWYCHSQLADGQGNCNVCGMSQTQSAQYPTQAAGQYSSQYPAQAAGQYSSQYPAQAAGQYSSQYPAQAAGQYYSQYPSQTPAPYSAQYPPQYLMNYVQAPVTPQVTNHPCMKCGTYSMRVEESVYTSGKAYSCGLGCLGFFLLGPFGLLLGAFGPARYSVRRAYYLCNYCGERFRVPNNIDKEILAIRNATKSRCKTHIVFEVIIGILLALLCGFALFLHMESGFDETIGIVFGVIAAFLVLPLLMIVLMHISVNSKASNQISSLRSEKARIENAQSIFRK